MCFICRWLAFINFPLISTLLISKLLQEFGRASGLRVNMTKSATLNVSTSSSLFERLWEHYAFTWSNKHIPYLGINFSVSIGQPYSANYPPSSKNWVQICPVGGKAASLGWVEWTLLKWPSSQGSFTYFTHSLSQSKIHTCRNFSGR